MRTGSGGFGVERVEVRDLVILEGGGEGEGRYFVVEGRQIRLVIRSQSFRRARRLPEIVADKVSKSRPSHTKTTYIHRWRRLGYERSRLEATTRCCNRSPWPVGSIQWLARW